MCSGNFKSKCLIELLNATNEKTKNEFIVKVRDMKITKTLLSTEDKTRNEFNTEEKFSMVEKTLLSKLQLRSMHKRINNLMCCGFKSEFLTELLNVTNEKTKNEFIVKVRGMKIKKSLLSIEDKAKDKFIAKEKFSMVEKTLLSKLQLQIMHKKINNLMSCGFKSEALTELLNTTNEKTKNEFIVKVKGRKVKKTLLLPEDKPKNGFLAKRKFRIMEKPLLSKLQLRLMHGKINKKLGERRWKKLKKELKKWKKEFRPKHGLLPSEGLKLRIKKIQ